MEEPLVVLSESIILPKPSVVVELTAGTFGGMAQLLVGHPFDTIKVKLQNMPKPAAGEAPLYTGAMDATRKTIAQEGSLGLYKGMGAPLAFVSVFNACLFAANGFMRTLVANGRSTEEMGLHELALCGTGAGLAVSFVATPTELVKCRLQAQTAGGAYGGPVDVARKVVSVSGAQGLYKGLGATLAREMPANAVYFGSYEGVKRWLTPKGGRTADLATWQLMVAGGTAGLGFWGSVYPMDLIKTRIQSDSDLRPQYKGIIDCFRKIVKTEGFSALYRGVGPCLLRSVPANGVTFVVYEHVKKFLTS
eukprot:Plantae.Rhodophyta-Hildenbrandia_rubra.ctg6799.p1 GENE.Plantae.Rhodophyta-Hildenbrandia_rubra.ctg6799~~Plantae.Rhodophyta-Hildenbrandia_rubra.ctg6799.p1  ORF type:complete len:306 (+),score=47.19 Plantae.Rhodophyta-Hildenbrandia_rubra.ctg6799:611-1528(+)